MNPKLLVVFASVVIVSALVISSVFFGTSSASLEFQNEGAYKTLGNPIKIPGFLTRVFALSKHAEKFRKSGKRNGEHADKGKKVALNTFLCGD